MDRYLVTTGTWTDVYEALSLEEAIEKYNLRAGSSSQLKLWKLVVPVVKHVVFSAVINSNGSEETSVLYCNDEMHAIDTINYWIKNIIFSASTKSVERHNNGGKFVVTFNNGDMIIKEYRQEKVYE